MLNCVVMILTIPGTGNRKCSVGDDFIDVRLDQTPGCGECEQGPEKAVLEGSAWVPVRENDSALALWL